MNYTDLKLPKLAPGSHSEGSGDLCIMEAIAYIERLPHSDMPKCTSPVVAKFCQGINDLLPEERRDELWQFAVRIAGTASPEHDQARAEYLAMAAVNKFAVMACEGRIDPSLVDAMRDAKDLKSAYAAAYAAANAADAADAAGATRAAVYAAVAARDADAAGGTNSVWDAALEVLDGLLDIGNPKPISWEKVAQTDWEAVTHEQ